MNKFTPSFVLTAIALAVAAPASAQEVENTSFTTADGTRVLQHAIVLPASLGEVWDAFTTTEGARSWAAPISNVDFRVGGIWESSYRLEAEIGDPDNIRNRFVSYLPMKMISMQAIQAPPDFPHAELLAELVTVIELEEVASEHMQVTISMVGYRAGAGYDALYEFFDGGNAQSLRQLHRRFAQGPMDWQEALSSTRSR